MWWPDFYIQLAGGRFAPLPPVNYASRYRHGCWWRAMRCSEYTGFICTPTLLSLSHTNKDEHDKFRVTPRTAARKCEKKGFKFVQGGWHFENVHSMFNRAFANCASRCMETNCKIIKYFPTNTYNNIYFYLTTTSGRPECTLRRVMSSEPNQDEQLTRDCKQTTNN